jgi:2,3,4,5-tetrahydropyridine-2-carboxylate N-succinyltransferase
MIALSVVIEKAYDEIDQLNINTASTELLDAVAESLNQLDSGEIRVAQPSKDGWKVNEWVKKAVLLSFKLSNNTMIQGGFTNYFDKVKSKFQNKVHDQFDEIGARVVPPAVVRHDVLSGKARS